MELRDELSELYYLLDYALESLIKKENDSKLDNKISKNILKKIFKNNLPIDKRNNDNKDYIELKNLLHEIYNMKHNKIILNDNLVESLNKVYNYLEKEEKDVLKKHINNAISNTSNSLISEFQDKCNKFLDLLASLNLNNEFVYQKGDLNSLGTYVSVFNKLRNKMLGEVFNLTIENYIKNEDDLEEKIEELKKVYADKIRLTKAVDSITSCVSSLRLDSPIDFSSSIIFLEEIKSKNMLLLEEKDKLLENAPLDKIENEIEKSSNLENDINFYYDLAYNLFKLRVSKEKNLDKISELEHKMQEYSNKYNLSNIDKIEAGLIALERYSNDKEKEEKSLINKKKGISIYQDLAYKLHKINQVNPANTEKIKNLENKMKNCQDKYGLSYLELIEANIIALERYSNFISKKKKDKISGINIYKELATKLYNLKKENNPDKEEINKLELEMAKCSDKYDLNIIDKIDIQFKILESN